MQFKRRNPNALHPIHGAQGADKISPAGLSSLPLDLMNEAGLKKQAGSGLDPFWNDLLQAVRRRSIFNQQAFLFDTNVRRLRPYEERGYLIIQNVDPAASLYIGFGITPTATAGINLAPGGGYYEPIQVPQNEIYVVGTATGNGIIITAPLHLSGYEETQLTAVE